MFADARHVSETQARCRSINFWKVDEAGQWVITDHDKDAYGLMPYVGIANTYEDARLLYDERVNIWTQREG